MSGRVLWVTGLSGAGKSTLAHEVVMRLRAADEFVMMLDGDELREVFGAVAANAQNHGRVGRLALAMQYSHLCRVIAAQGLTVVIATISLFREVHAWNRANLPGYFEVYLNVPLEELQRRDPKGIYRRFDAGELNNVAGLDLSVDEPETADWVVQFDAEHTPSSLAEKLIKVSRTRNAPCALFGRLALRERLASATRCGKIRCLPGIRRATDCWFAGHRGDLSDPSLVSTTQGITNRGTHCADCCPGFPLSVSLAHSRACPRAAGEIVMSIFERLSEVSSTLPPQAQAELLDFAEFLQRRHRASLTPPSTPLKSLVGGLEDSANFAGSPMSIQESLRREWA